MRKEVIYDFGKLGKWSGQTLKCNAISIRNMLPSVMHMKYKVSSIEAEYKRLKCDAQTVIDECRHKSCIFVNIGNISDGLKRLHNAENVLNNLNKNYTKYKDTLKYVMR